MQERTVEERGLRCTEDEEDVAGQVLGEKDPVGGRSFPEAIDFGWGRPSKGPFGLGPSVAQGIVNMRRDCT